MDEYQPNELPSSSSGSGSKLISRELERLIEGAPDVSGSGEFFTSLPGTSAAEAVAFLRTVPTGTPLSELPERAAAWRAAHPLAEFGGEDRG